MVDLKSCNLNFRPSKPLHESVLKATAAFFAPPPFALYEVRRAVNLYRNNLSSSGIPLLQKKVLRNIAVYLCFTNVAYYSLMAGIKQGTWDEKTGFQKMVKDRIDNQTFPGCTQSEIDPNLAKNSASLLLALEVAPVVPRYYSEVVFGGELPAPEGFYPCVGLGTPLDFNSHIAMALISLAISCQTISAAIKNEDIPDVQFNSTSQGKKEALTVMATIILSNVMVAAIAIGCGFGGLNEQDSKDNPNQSNVLILHGLLWWFHAAKTIQLLGTRYFIGSGKALHFVSPLTTVIRAIDCIFFQKTPYSSKQRT